MLQDIAILTGGQVITSELGLELKAPRWICWAMQDRLLSRRKPPPLSAVPATRMQSLQECIRSVHSWKPPLPEFDKEKLQERLAKLAGGVAVIKVGAATEIEMKEKKLRIEDALAATKAAVEEGIVAGGGTALINAIPAVKACMDEVSGDEKTGVSIVLKALEEPVRQIALNSGLEGSVIIDKDSDLRQSRLRL